MQQTKQKHNGGGFTLKQSFYAEQLSLGDLYKELTEMSSNEPPKLFSLLSRHFSLGKFISEKFRPVQ